MKYFSVLADRHLTRLSFLLSLASCLLFSLPAPAVAQQASGQDRMTYDDHKEGAFPRFPANTNVVALSTNHAGMAWRQGTTNRIPVPQNSVLIVWGITRGLTTQASNTSYGFSGSVNGSAWVTNVYTVTIPASGFLTNRFAVPVATNLPYNWIVYDKAVNQDAVAITNDLVGYLFLPYRH